MTAPVETSTLFIHLIQHLFRKLVETVDLLILALFCNFTILRRGNGKWLKSVAVLAVLATGVFGVDIERVSVMEGDPVILNTSVHTNQQENIRWYNNENANLIAQINGSLSKICLDVNCTKGNERFKHRLSLDHETGSLTIIDTTTEDSREYKLKIFSHSNFSEKIFKVSVKERASVMEGDSVTLKTGVQTNQLDNVRWYVSGIQIAQIRGDLSKNCTDFQCNVNNGKLKDRLKLDHQTGSLTITNTRTTDSGEYTLKIFSNSGDSEKNFNVAVHDVAAEMKTKSVKEEEAIVLDSGRRRKTDDVMMWHFKGICIAEMTGDQSQICTEGHCKERFRDRLKVDHQTGSLTITSTTNTDSGEYQLQISNSRFSITRSFSVSVAPPGLSSAAVGGICAAIVVLLASAPTFHYLKKKCTERKLEVIRRQIQPDEELRVHLNGQTSHVPESNGAPPL